MTPASPARRPMTVEDLWKMRRVGAPVAPADGSFAIVPVTEYDMDSNEGSTRLWRLAPGTPERPLTAEGAKSASPALSPDGTRVAFVRPDAKKRGQLAVMPLDGGEAEILTDLPLGITDPRWFPDGRRIAFLGTVYREALDPGSARELMERREKDKVKAYVTEDTVFRYWDDWITDGRVHHIFMLDLETRELTDLTPDSRRWFDMDAPEGNYDISPDGKEIAFSADRSDPPHDVLNYDVFVVDVASRTTRNLTHDNPGHDLRPRYSPDGRYLLYGMQRMLDFYADRVRLVLRDRTTGKDRVLTEDWDRSASSWEFLPGSDGIVFTAEDRAVVSVFRMGLEAGTPEELRRGGTFAGLVPLAGGDVLASGQGISSPAEVVRLPAGGGDPVRWSRFNDAMLETLELGGVRERFITGSDGREIQCWEVLPPGFTPDRKWPMLLVVHGGPHGIWSDQFHYRWNLQLFAASGYVVVAPNPHGSTSFGQDFAICIEGGWGDKPYRDCMAVTEAMARTGYVDPDRIAAAGGSYGGYMMAWMAGQTDRFACLVNHAGVSNLLTEYASDMVYDWGRALGGTPWDGIGAIDAMNPIRFAAGFKSPMLVIHGEKDYRVPMSQALEIYNVYRCRGLPARLVVYPDENHWVLKPQNGRLWYREVNAWLERWVGPKV